MSLFGFFWLTLLYLLIESAALFFSIMWLLNASSVMVKVAWSLILMTSLMTFILLVFHEITPNSIWQMMVDSDSPQSGPYGRRAFSTLFWPISWLIFLIPFLGLKLLFDHENRSEADSLFKLRALFLFVLVHFGPSGYLLLQHY